MSPRLALLPVAFLAWVALASVFGEKVPERDGLGWDGADYAAMASLGPLELVGKVDTYRAQRLAPPTIVHLGATLVGWPLEEPRQLVLAFAAYQVALLACGVAVWWRLCRHLRLSPQGSVLCFAGLFLGYATLKLTPLSTTITDPSALVLGLLMVHLHLTRRPGWLALTTAVGAFTFPTLLASGLILLLVPPSTASPPPAPTRADAWPAFAVGGVVVLACLAVHATGFGSRADVTPAPATWLAVTFAALGGVYLVVALRPLLGARLILSTARTIPPQSAAWAGLVLLVVPSLLLAAADTQVRSKQPTGIYFGNTLQTVLVAPLGGLVCTAAYFGPLVLIAAARWREVCAALRQRPGLHALAAAFVVFSVGMESRQLISGWPVFVVAVCLVLDRRPLSWPATLGLVLVSVAASRCWLPINHGPLTGDHLQFPDQWYFMMQGPWMTTTSFWLNVAACVVVAALVAPTGAFRAAPGETDPVTAPTG